MRRLRSVLLGIVAVLALATVGFLVWAHIEMLGERDVALEVWENDAVSVTSTDGTIVLSPEVPNGSGLVFIPGAKVDPYAYMYKLSGIVESGTTVVITKPTLNLAFFDTRSFDELVAGVDGVDNWLIGGHSLGGVKACMLAETDERITGLALFGSYCANDLSDSGLAVVSIAASEDGLSTQTKIKDAAHELPADTEFAVIDGANHASFGDYGRQPGDGTATASDEDVRDEITGLVAALVETGA